jgi:acyl-CoA thioesterase YciA
MMDLTFNTNFTIMPNQCNYQTPLVFGGALFSQMDLCAAVCATRLLRDSESECNTAVTHKSNVTFHKPSYMGDIIFLEATITELRKKAIVIEVTVHKESRKQTGNVFIAEGEFVFVSMKDGKYANHNLEMP